jgi:hypothetical protein
MRVSLSIKGLAHGGERLGEILLSREKILALVSPLAPVTLRPRCCSESRRIAG